MVSKWLPNDRQVVVKWSLSGLPMVAKWSPSGLHVVCQCHRVISGMNGWDWLNGNLCKHLIYEHPSWSGANNDDNMVNVPMCQLACCIPEIGDGAGWDLFSLLTPAPLTYSLLEPAKNCGKKYWHKCPVLYRFHTSNTIFASWSHINKLWCKKCIMCLQ